MALRVHLFPFRTQKLSSITPKILRWWRLGKIGRCQHSVRQPCFAVVFFYLILSDSRYGSERIINEKWRNKISAIFYLLLSISSTRSSTINRGRPLTSMYSLPMYSPTMPTETISRLPINQTVEKKNFIKFSSMLLCVTRKNSIKKMLINVMISPVSMTMCRECVEKE